MFSWLQFFFFWTTSPAADPDAPGLHLEVDAEFCRELFLDGEFSESEIEVDAVFCREVEVDAVFCREVDVDGDFCREMEIDGIFR